MTCRLAVALVIALATAGQAAAAGNADVAALQVALADRGVYSATIDGIRGPATVTAVKTFQRRVGLAADGIAGPRTRSALGDHGRPAYRSRTLAPGTVGWDVAALQFRLAWHGFPSGLMDGHFGMRLEAALRRFQDRAGITADGVAGPATYIALARRPPRFPAQLASPLPYPISGQYGPRGQRFHSGVDIAAPHGTPVRAARRGHVAYAGLRGSYGLVVVLTHAGGVQTWYAHLSRVDVVAGSHVERRTVIGRVGSTGASTGPHLHFETRLRGAAVKPPDL